MGKSKVGHATKWDIIKDFIRNWKKREITRQDLILHLHKLDRCKMDPIYFSVELIDTYRLYLINACYIAHKINPVTGRKVPGVYRKVRTIPKKLTLEDCVEMAYPGSKQRRRSALFNRAFRRMEVKPNGNFNMQFKCDGSVKIQDEGENS